MRVLIVDDNATNRRILEETLGNIGLQTASAAAVAEAISCMREADTAGQPFQLVLTDVNMPAADGFEFAERLLKDPSLTPAIVMMLTSGDRPGDAARSRELNVASYIMKPVKPSELLETILLALGKSFTTAESHPDLEPADASGEIRPLQILLAEDSLANQVLAVKLLEKWGHTVTVAKNGRAAVALAITQTFDLILMDVQMPEMDGFDATVAIREHEEDCGQAHVPIIAMTAHVMKGDRQRCLDSGMDGYVSKPIRRRELLAEIQPFFSGRTEQPESSWFQASHDDIDWSRGKETTGNDEDLLKEVIAALLAETPKYLDDIRRAADAGNAADLNNAVHALKGTIRVIAVDELIDLGQEIEIQAHEGNLDALDSRIRELDSRVRRLFPALRAFVKD
jgi:CheY-like chemotaxis protein